MQVYGARFTGKSFIVPIHSTYRLLQKRGTYQLYGKIHCADTLEDIMGKYERILIIKGLIFLRQISYPVPAFGEGFRSEREVLSDHFTFQRPRGSRGLWGKREI